MPTTEMSLGQTRNFYGMLKAVQTRATQNQALTGLSSIGGYVVQAGDRVFLNGQTAPLENGIWVVDSGAWERAGDSEPGDDLGKALFLITQGTVANQIWQVANDAGGGIIGTDSVTAGQIASTAFQGNFYWSIPFTNGSDDFKDDSNSSFQSFAKIIFPGSDNVGTAVAKIIAWVDDAGKTADFRLRDVTNNNTIAQLNNVGNTSPIILDLGTLTNLSSGESTWEFQARNTDGGTYFFSTMAIGTNL